MKTVLCVPGHDLKKVEGCRRYGADLILFDLEDSVPEGKKELAREIVKAHVQPTDAVRVNLHFKGRDSAIEEACEVGDECAIWIPKMRVFGPAVFQHYMLNIPNNAYGERIVYIIETPGAVRDLSRFGDMCAGLAFGAADFAAYMNVPADSPQVDYARQQVALAAAALGVPAYDSPCTLVGVRREHPKSAYNEAYRAQQLGYQWKGVVHPTQIEEVRRVRVFAKNNDRDLVMMYDNQSEAVMVSPAGCVVAPPMIRAARKRLEDSER